MGFSERCRFQLAVPASSMVLSRCRSSQAGRLSLGSTSDHNDYDDDEPLRRDQSQCVGVAAMAGRNAGEDASIHRLHRPTCSRHLHQPHRETPVHYRVSLLGRPERSVPDGLLFYRRCSLGSHISDVPRPMAPKLCHMIGIWLKRNRKFQKLGYLS